MQRNYQLTFGAAIIIRRRYREAIGRDISYRRYASVASDFECTDC